jgi:phage terminase large subunit-like protein
MVATSQSPIVELLSELVELGAEEQALAELSELELAALGADWSAWCRPNQAVPPTVELSDPPPPEGEMDKRWGRTHPGKPWRVGLVIGGRGTGKSAANLMYAHHKAMRMEWPRMIFCAQTMDQAVKIFIREGVLSELPAWERPWKETADGLVQLRWPSGATATITSANSKERGGNCYAAICSEVIDWSPAVAVAAWNSINDLVRLGDGQILVDTTAMGGDPIVAQIKQRAEETDRYWWIRHAAADNDLHLVKGYREDQRARYRGTDKELEEVDGIEGAERGMVRRRDIEAARRHLPTAWRRRIVILDPAYTSPFPGKKPDTAGVLSMGEGIDGQLYLTDDRSGVQAIESWAAESVDLYITNRCDCLVIETNRGGQLPTSMVRAAAEKRGWGNVVVVADDAKTRHVPGTIYVKEVFAEHDKWTRGELLRDLYRAGLVSHVLGADTGEVEKTLTGWYPTKRGERSPGDLDADAWGCRELGGHLLKRAPEGQGAINRAVRQQQASAPGRRRVGQLHPTQHGSRDVRGRI